MSIANLEGITAAVLGRIDGNRGTLAVDWPGSAFDTNAVSEWLQPAVVFVNARRARESHEDLAVQVSINCFAKRSTNLYRHYELADLVAGWFRCLDLPLAAGGWIRFQEPQERVVPLPAPAEEGLRQVNVSVVGRVID